MVCDCFLFLGDLVSSWECGLESDLLSRNILLGFWGGLLKVIKLIKIGYASTHFVHSSVYITIFFIIVGEKIFPVVKNCLFRYITIKPYSLRPILHYHPSPTVPRDDGEYVWQELLKLSIDDVSL